MNLIDDAVRALGPPQKASPTRRTRAERGLFAERACAVLCLVAAAFIGVRAESLVSQSSIARPGAFPAHGALWLGAGVLGLASLAWTVQAFRRKEAVHVPDLGRSYDVLAVFAVLMVGAWSATWLGLLLAAGLTYVALLFYYRDKNWVFVLGSVIGYLLFLHYGLEVLLGVPLARSPILPLAF